MNDELEQAYRQGLTEGKKEDSRITKIANHYGYTAQSDITVEECAELTQAICKLRRAWSNERLANVKEETADVLIMARQLRVMLGSEEIDRIINSKLDRQMERIASETKCDRYLQDKYWGLCTNDMVAFCCKCGGDKSKCDLYPTKRRETDETTQSADSL